eukprot:SAG31_NODE_598_length_13651_cov_10.681818_4_plen_113_part_00
MQVVQIVTEAVEIEKKFAAAGGCCDPSLIGLDPALVRPSPQSRNEAFETTANVLFWQSFHMVIAACFLSTTLVPKQLTRPAFAADGGIFGVGRRQVAQRVRATEALQSPEPV